MQSIETIREFKTRQFCVVVDAIEDYNTDLSWDETGKVRNKLENGDLVSFCARARVIHNKLGELASDYLGGCIYEQATDFQDHRECAAQTRKLRAAGSNAVCGSYFADMISTVISEARQEIDRINNLHIYVRL